MQNSTKIYQYVDFTNLEDKHVNLPIEIYARVHNVRKSSSSLAFVILRYQQITLQCICLKKIMGEEQFNIVTKLSSESLVLLEVL